jgi:hypothetical protein
MFAELMLELTDGYLTMIAVKAVVRRNVGAYEDLAVFFYTLPVCWFF